MPRPITIVQCRRDQGSRSRRAGTAVVITPGDPGDPGDPGGFGAMRTWVRAPSTSSELAPSALPDSGYAPSARDTV
ncbi:hypothetical protein E4N62_00710 [Streptomyces sp. MNU76]|nr:hypothetical protein [Streptomyces sp. MNU76]MCC9703919.1 hypothetical protein [Streptomyces sp. MNU76]